MPNKEKQTPSPLQFEADGVTYQFIYPQIEVDKIIYKAVDLVQATEGSQEEKVLAHLVNIGSGSIEVVQSLKAGK